MRRSGAGRAHARRRQRRTNRHPARHPARSRSVSRCLPELERSCRRLLSATAHSEVHGLTWMLAPLSPNEGRPGKALVAVNIDPRELAVELVVRALTAHSLALTNDVLVLGVRRANLRTKRRLQTGPVPYVRAVLSKQNSYSRKNSSATWAICHYQYGRADWREY